MTTRRPAGSNWGDYGEGDRIGRLNELTDERVVRAAAEIRTGRRFCLSLPLDYPGGNVVVPFRFPPERRPVDRGGAPAADFPLSRVRDGATDVVNDDVVTLWTQYSTQWDAFGHIGSHFDADGDGDDEVVYYNGHYPGPDVDGMATIGLQARGVIVDLHRVCGEEKTAVDYAMLANIMRDQNITVEPGDVLALRTGWTELLLGMDRAPVKEIVHGTCAGLDGRDPALLRWIAESGVAAIVADNVAVEHYPPKPGPPGEPLLPLHELCLFKLGINLGEMWYLTELADWLRDNQRTRFFLTAPPLRLRGHVGSPVTPIATV
ncbi:MAG TPA: cyclase family protein [Candidatus Elarobacter sp.]|jgi:kynurenine formamidase|nr:cyclase family protein [Candidatus Elarobacter sp.]